ncbi:hypothetical protein [Phenylobacterium sp.]|uniref:hypothetical protein n=1 Tax=Phenylobacterium sp. TaxID=1871053 RepID=UPI00271AE3F7|nr:hypothetical protein [Phenylobacterium sp.]MDO8800581.1 hypothetical protein [Phenylobacterium sp.]
MRRRRVELEKLEATLTQMASRCDGACATSPLEPCAIFDDIAALPAAAARSFTPGRAPKDA